MRHRRNALEAEDSYSDEDDDAFAALSRKAKRPKIAVSNRQSNTTGSKSSDINSNSNETKDPPSTKVSVTTSSMKRHHGALTDARKAKMDALLVELAEESKPKAKQQQQHHSQRQQQQQVRGSFVQPGEEHITTNLFVGNLAPSITEEQLSELFSQFGTPIVLHSVCYGYNTVLFPTPDPVGLIWFG